MSSLTFGKNDFKISESIFDNLPLRWLMFLRGTCQPRRDNRVILMSEQPFILANYDFKGKIGKSSFPHHNLQQIAAWHDTQPSFFFNLRQLTADCGKSHIYFPSDCCLCVPWIEQKFLKCITLSLLIATTKSKQPNRGICENKWVPLNPNTDKSKSWLI